MLHLLWFSMLHLLWCLQLAWATPATAPATIDLTQATPTLLYESAVVGQLEMRSQLYAEGGLQWLTPSSAGEVVLASFNPGGARQMAESDDAIDIPDLDPARIPLANEGLVAERIWVQAVIPRENEPYEIYETAVWRHYHFVDETTVIPLTGTEWEELTQTEFEHVGADGLAYTYWTFSAKSNPEASDPALVEVPMPDAVPQLPGVERGLGLTAVHIADDIGTDD